MSSTIVDAGAENSENSLRSLDLQQSQFKVVCASVNNSPLTANNAFVSYVF